MRTREVSAAAAASSTRISWLWKVMRSPQARLENGPGVDAAAPGQDRVAVEPATIEGSVIAIFTDPPRIRLASRRLQPQRAA